MRNSVKTGGTTAITLSHALSLSLYFLDVTIPDVDLQWAPLPQLLTRRSSANSQKESMDEQDAVFKVVRVCLTQRNVNFMLNY